MGRPTRGKHQSALLASSLQLWWWKMFWLRIAVISIVVVGCGGDDDNSAGSDAAPPPDATESPCTRGSDCTACVYPTRVVGTDQCECLACPFFPVSLTECEARQQAFFDVCTANGLPKNCAPVDCAEPPTVDCVELICRSVDP